MGGGGTDDSAQESAGGGVGAGEVSDMARASSPRRLSQQPDPHPDKLSSRSQVRLSAFFSYTISFDPYNQGISIVFKLFYNYDKISTRILICLVWEIS